jgi:hypothetical protein
MFALVIDEKAAAHGEEPWGEAFEFAGRPDFEVAEKCFLHGIARGLGVTAVMPRERQQRSLEAVEKGLG